MSIDFESLTATMLEDSDRWFGEGMSSNLTIMSLGLFGESGECADIIKKLMRGTLTMEEARDLLEVELIDVFIYWTHLVAMLKIDVEAVYNRKRVENESRWGDGKRGRSGSPESAGSGV